MKMNEKMLLSICETAIELGVSRPMVYKLLETDNEFRKTSIRIGRRVLISREALKEWVAGRRNMEA